MATLTAPAPSGGDDQTALQNFLNTAATNDVLSFPASRYLHSSKLMMPAGVTGVTINATGTTWAATNTRYASFTVRGNNTTINGLTLESKGATTRVDLAEDVGPLVVKSIAGTTLNSVTIDGSAGLGLYYWNATGGALNKVLIKNTLADGFHFTNGSGGFTATDCQALNNGDDAFAHIGYQVDGSTGRPQNITLVRPVVRDCRARSISYSGAVSCTANNVDLDGSLAAAIYFATERGDFNTLDCANNTVNGGRILRAGTSYAAIPGGTDGNGKDQGFILWLASGSGATVTNCVVNDISTGETGPANYDTFRAIAYSGTFSGCSANRTQLYKNSPSTYVGGNTPASISPQTSTDRRTETIPASTATIGTPGGTGGTTEPTPGTRGPTPTGCVHNWTAKSLTGLADGASVTSWSDTGTLNTTLTTGNAAPTKSTLSGKPVVVFNGTSQSLTNLSAPTIAQPHTIVAALYTTTISGDRQLVWQGNGGEMSIYQGKYFAYAGQSINATSTPALNAVTFVTTAYTGNDSVMYVNGAQAATGVLGTNSMDGGRILIGNHGGVTRYWSGGIYAIRVYNKILTAAERATVHSEMQDDFGGTSSDYVAASGGTTPTPSPGRTLPTALRKYVASSITGVANGDTVAAWPEVTGGTSLTNSTVATRPTYTLSAVNGRPGVTFTSAGKQLEATVATQAQPVTITLIVDQLGGGEQQAYHHGSEVVGISNKWLGYSGNGVSAGNSVTGPQVVTYTANGTSSTIHVNGTLQGSGNAGTTGYNTLLRIGRHVDNGRPFIGTILEVHEYSYALSAAQRQAVHSQAQDDYGIAVSDYYSAAPAYSASATETGTGTSSASAKPSFSASYVDSATGTLSAVGVAPVVSAVAFSGAGTTTALQSALVASATYQGTGVGQTSVPSSTPRPVSSFTDTATGQTTTTSSMSASGAALNTGSGTLSATGVYGVSASASGTGSGTTATSGRAAFSVSAPHTGTGALSAVGRVSVSVSMGAVGTSTAAGSPSATAAVTQTGAGTTAATGSLSLVSTTNGTGAGATSATGSNPATAGQAAHSGAGATTATGQPVFAAAVSMTGLGSTSAVTTSTTASGAAAFTGTGTTATSSGSSGRSDVTLGGSGALSAAAQTLNVSSSTADAGVGQSTADGVKATFNTAASHTGTGQLAAVGSPVFSGGSTETGVGASSAQATFGITGLAQFAGLGLLTVTAAPSTSVSMALSGSGTSATYGAPSVASAASTTGTSLTSLQAYVSFTSASSQVATGTLYVETPGAGQFSVEVRDGGVGTLSTLTQATATVRVQDGGVGKLTASGTLALLYGEGTTLVLTRVRGDLELSRVTGDLVSSARMDT